MITIQAGYALVIDDEPANRDFLERLLQTASFKVSGAATGADGVKSARSFAALALALVDQELPDAPGLEIIMKLRAENPESLLVMATMHDDRTLIDQAFAAGVDVFLVKPHGFMELYRRLKEVDANTDLLRNVIIDQYGPRPYKGAEKRAALEGKKATGLPGTPQIPVGVGSTSPTPSPSLAPDIQELPAKPELPSLEDKTVQAMTPG